LVLHDGRLVETGTHDKLMARHGVYEQLFTSQARSYFETLEPLEG